MVICGLCHKRIGEDIIVIPLRQTNGALDTLVCLSCARTSGMFCVRHNVPHLGFNDDTTACPVCIKEVVDLHDAGACEIETILFFSITDKEEKARLLRAAELSAIMTGQPREICILRFAATLAIRTGRSLDDVVTEIGENGTAPMIL